MTNEEAIDLACGQAPVLPPTRPLHGVRPPMREIQTERAQHRLAAFLYASGQSQVEIARRLDVNATTVSNWVRQKWFQEFIREEIALLGRDAVHGLLKAAAVDSVLTLIVLRDDEDTPATVRRQCASDIIDRAYGKAPAVVAHAQVDTISGDITKVGAELKRMLNDKALMQSVQSSLS